MLARELAVCARASEDAGEAGALAGAFQKTLRAVRLTMALDLKLDRDAAREARTARPARPSPPARRPSSSRPRASAPTKKPRPSGRGSSTLRKASTDQRPNLGGWGGCSGSGPDADQPTVTVNRADVAGDGSQWGHFGALCDGHRGRGHGKVRRSDPCQACGRGRSVDERRSRDRRGVGPAALPRTSTSCAPKGSGGRQSERAAFFASRADRANLLSPLRGEGRVWGCQLRVHRSGQRPHNSHPHPNPSPQGGGAR